jgi:hypothetical protein
VGSSVVALTLGLELGNPLALGTALTLGLELGTPLALGFELLDGA